MMRATMKRTTFSYLYRATLIAVICFVYTAPLSPSNTPRTYREKRAGVVISFAVEDAMFPESWYQPPVSGNATAIDEGEIPRTLTIISRALRKYPTAVLRRNLRKIVVVKHLYFYGVPYGGSYSLDTVYIVNDGEKKGYDAFYLEQLIHHEFSSILFHNYRSYFDEEMWALANPKGFHYLGDGVEAIRKGCDGTDFGEHFFHEGFLYEYGKASLEEDVNTFAENMFKSKEGFWDAVMTHKRLRRKFGVIMRFYYRIDTNFSPSFFRFVSTR